MAAALAQGSRVCCQDSSYSRRPPSPCPDNRRQFREIRPKGVPCGASGAARGSSVMIIGQGIATDGGEGGLRQAQAGRERERERE